MDYVAGILSGFQVVFQLSNFFYCFIGVFIGPTLLTVGYSLTKEILSHPRNTHSHKSTNKSEKDKPEIETGNETC